MILLLIGVTFDMTQILGLIFPLLTNLSIIDSSGWMVSLTAAMTFFRGLDLRLICVSKREIVELSFVFVPIPIFSIGLALSFFANSL